MILRLFKQTFQIIDTLLGHLISVLHITLSLPLFSMAFNFLITVFILCWKILVSRQPSLAKQVCSDHHRVQQGSPSLRITSSLWIFSFQDIAKQNISQGFWHLSHSLWFLKLTASGSEIICANSFCTL